GRSARARASAQASLPEMSNSLSPDAVAAAGGVGVTTAMSFSSVLALLGPGVLAGDACGDLDTALLQVPLDLLLVLAAEAEAVRADDVVLGLDLVAEPGRVPRLVLDPHLPLARVVV